MKQTKESADEEERSSTTLTLILTLTPTPTRDAVDELYDASRCPSVVSVRAQNLHAAFLRPQQAKRTGLLPIGLPPLSNWTRLGLGFGFGLGSG